MRFLLVCLGFIFISQLNYAQDNWYSTDYDDSGWNQSVANWNNSAMGNSMWDLSGSEFVIFRKVLTLNSTPSSASIEISADNVYMLAINQYDKAEGEAGGLLKADGEWRGKETYDITNSLKAGDNIFAISALDMGSYEGLYVKIIVDGNVVSSSIDGTWKSLGVKLNDNWYSADYDDNTWNQSTVNWSNSAMGNSMWDPSGSEFVIFRKVLTLNSIPSSASIEISADNVYMLAINQYDKAEGEAGGLLKADGEWRGKETYDITNSLKAGENIFAISALDMGSYEGLYVKIIVDGNVVSSSTDGTWRSLAIEVPTNTIAHWNFNENGGSVLTDVSGNGHNGTITNATWVDGALEFDGTNSEVIVPYSSAFSGMKELTVKTRFLVSSLPSVGEYAKIVAVQDKFSGFNSSTNQAFNLGIYRTSTIVGLHFGVRTGSNTSYDGTGVIYEYNNLPLNEWIEVSAICDNGYYYLYVNGMQVAVKEGNTNAIIKEANTPLTIGYSIGTTNDNDNVNTHFAGKIDDIKILSNIVTSIDNNEVETISNYILLQNYPNPFNPTTVISYSIPRTEFVEITVFDVLGREIATLVNEVKTAGNYEVNFEATQLSSGIYFYTIKANNFIKTKKMILLR